MKTTKKILAMILAMVMMLGMVTSVSAATITINGGASGSEYAAYKLMKAEALTDGSKKYNFTVNSKYKAVLEEIIKEATETTETTNDDIVEYISGLNDDSIRKFADEVYAKVKEAELEPDYTTKTDVFENVDSGYYLIAETKLGTTDTDKTDTYSLVMLNTAGVEDITVTTKEDVPTVDKQVEEKNDTTGQEDDWGKSADYDIGDTINYKITGTVSSRYANYKSYYYSFSDTMDAGLSLLTSEEDSDNYAYSIKIMIGGVDVTTKFDIVATEHSFTATANLKELDEKLEKVTITGDTHIVVTYTAVLNENAVSGTAGNKNDVVLKYENNPYHDGEGSEYGEPEKPGETPKDVNIVFTFDAIVNKTDDKGEALNGAEFTLYKKCLTDTEGDDKYEYQVVEKISGDNTAKFLFEGLDAGEYKLVETKVPKGHNKAEDIIFTVAATYDTKKDPVELTALVVKDAKGNTISSTDSSNTNAQFFVTLSSGEMSTTVINKAGMNLPSTGGMGTTIFYVIGGILVVGAAVLLITKRRMRSE